MIKVTLDRETKNFRPCWKCGGTNLTVHDCGYSSFNVGHTECADCGYTVECSPILFHPIKTLSETWNGDKTKARKKLKALNKEAAILTKLLTASDKRGEK